MIFGALSVFRTSFIFELGTFFVTELTDNTTAWRVRNGLSARPKRANKRLQIAGSGLEGFHKRLRL
jgi:hypothetical protein